MSYLMNTWYQAGWSDELPAGAMLARTFLDTPVLLFRDPEGRVSAVLDRCPHRFAPLSAGKLSDGVITCGYHGLAFDKDGRCVRNPHGGISKAMCVPAFPVLERHEALWIWMGDRDRANPEAIADLSFISSTPAPARITGTLPTKANYQLLVDNIMDLSHADYLHPTTLGGVMEGCKMKVKEEGNQVIIDYFAENCIAPPNFHSLVPPPAKADVWFGVQWLPPAVMILTATAKPTGMPRLPIDINPSVHSMTPETLSTTHYFYGVARKFQVDDEALTATMKTVIERAFIVEDKPMLEKQQRRIGNAELFSMKPVLLSIDAAAVRVRRKFEKLIAAEGEARPTSWAPTEVHPQNRE